MRELEPKHSTNVVRSVQVSFDDDGKLLITLEIDVGDGNGGAGGERRTKTASPTTWEYGLKHFLTNTNIKHTDDDD